MRAHARVYVRMCVVLQVLGQVLQVLGCMCVMLQVLGLLQVLGQVLGLAVGAGAGAGTGPSPLIDVQPPLYIRQTPETPEPLNTYIFYDADITPEGKKRYFPGVS